MRSSSANPPAGAERAPSAADTAASARRVPAGLVFREIDESPAGLAALGRFYRERYVAAFPDPDERESLANMRHYLALKAAGWYGPNNHRKDKAGVPGEKDTDEGAIDVTEGGTAIPYWLEDPFLRKEYEETLAKEGVKSRMEEELYHPPVGQEAREPATA